MTSHHRPALAAAVLAVAVAAASPALAGGSSMPWEAPLQSILESIEGPVAKIIAVMIIIVTGLTLAFGDTSLPNSAISLGVSAPPYRPGISSGSMRSPSRSNTTFSAATEPVGTRVRSIS